MSNCVTKIVQLYYDLHNELSFQQAQSECLFLLSTFCLGNWLSFCLLCLFSSVCCIVVVTSLRHLSRSSWLMPSRTSLWRSVSSSAQRKMHRESPPTTRRCQCWRTRRRLVPFVSGLSPTLLRLTMSFLPSASPGLVTGALRRISLPAYLFSDKLIQGSSRNQKHLFAHYRTVAEIAWLNQLLYILVHGVPFGFLYFLYHIGWVLATVCQSHVGS